MAAELRHRTLTAADSDTSTPPSPSLADPLSLPPHNSAPATALSRSSSLRSLSATLHHHHSHFKPSPSTSTPLSTPWTSVKLPLPLFTRNAADDFLSGGLPLFDMLVSLEAHLDLLQRRWRPVADEWKAEWKVKAKEAGVVGSKTRDGLREGMKQVRAVVRGTPAEREFKEFLLNTKLRVKRMQEQWNDSKLVSMRDKLSFFASVNNVLLTTLMLAFWPQYIPIAYTVQAIYFLPWRVYSYKKLAYHYFCFDLCYFVNVMVLLYLWVFPSSTLLFLGCYGLTLGPLATAIATWRNSLVFHSLEKVTSLYIHLYPPLVMIVLVHFYPDAPQRYKALHHLATERAGGGGGRGLPKTLTILTSSVMYLIWQVMYWRLVLVARKDKIEKGERTTSFTYMLQAKHGIISKVLKSIPEKKRAGSFIVAQFVYTVVTMVPAVYWLFESKFWSSIYLWAMFAVSVWNGASFYMEVFGRRFERELHSLRKELDELQRDLATSRVSTTMIGTPTPPLHCDPQHHQLQLPQSQPQHQEKQEQWQASQASNVLGISHVPDVSSVTPTATLPSQEPERHQGQGTPSPSQESNQVSKYLEPQTQGEGNEMVDQAQGQHSSAAAAAVGSQTNDPTTLSSITTITRTTSPQSLHHHTEAERGSSSSSGGSNNSNSNSNSNSTSPLGSGTTSSWINLAGQS